MGETIERAGSRWTLMQDTSKAKPRYMLLELRPTQMVRRHLIGSVGVISEDLAVEAAAAIILNAAKEA